MTDCKARAVTEGAVSLAALWSPRGQWIYAYKHVHLDSIEFTGSSKATLDFVCRCGVGHTQMKKGLVEQDQVDNRINYLKQVGASHERAGSSIAQSNQSDHRSKRYML
jgi:hypothetical protein